MSYAIGTTYGNLTDMAELLEPVDYPRGEYEPYAKYVKLGDGTIKGLGLPVARWVFPIITVEQRDQLKEYCDGASAAVYITTKMNDDTFEDFTATMIWPNDEKRWGGGHFANLEIEFRNLEVVAVS